MGAENLDEIFNVQGGALATGSPWGAAGAILTIDLLNRMNQQNVGYGMAVTPAEGGQVMAVLLKGR
jgi:acetyl-CoA acetyltransferase